MATPSYSIGVSYSKQSRTSTAFDDDRARDPDSVALIINELGDRTFVLDFVGRMPMLDWDAGAVVKSNVTADRTEK